ncbi:putative ABC transport system permease protein [Kribbella orskensis]|uniref:ABC transport system permease protein n=1 Tax=Kribbella orskensis TaxID=2512216 RepID=A0ABY2BD28_9ACTN|nr:MULTISPECIES: FtsX-like permease family protein [Kribbella]TCN35036.1 putative ABC transport system permease protein [Kribbella sp. VKM Ac-2500]TCO16403.1 putative ABC transport system permease protein [Kribbella orskensis]
MIRLALRTLRYRKGGFIATFVAVVFGTAIVLACGGLMETGIRSNVPPERLAGAPIVVSGKQSHLRPGAEDATPLVEQVGVPATVVDKIRGLDGVTDVIGDLTFPAPVLRGPSPMPSEGHNWDSARLAPYTLQSGTAPRAGEVVLDATTAGQLGARVGGNVQLLAQGKPTSFRVSGIAAGPAGNTFFSTTDATRIAERPGQYSALGVLVAPGTDLKTLRKNIEKADGSVSALSGIDRGLVEHPDASQAKETLIAVAGSFGGIAAMTMMFVVASTLALSAQHRQREFALLRGIGTTPGQVRRMILGEAMVVSLPAVLVGCVPGVLLGRFLFDRLAANGVASPVVTFYQGLIPFAAGAGAAVLAAVGAALIAGRRSAKIRPVEALVEASLQRKWFSWVRLLFGLLFLAGGLALVIVTGAVMSGPLAGATAGPAVLCWAVGVALLGPVATKAVLAVLRWPLYAVSRVNGRLAILNVTARSVAMSAAVMPVMLAVGIATANIYMQTTQVDAASKAFTKDLRADAVLASTGAGLSPSLLTEVQGLPGVASASAYVTSVGVIDEPRNAPFDEEGAPLQGISAQGPDGTAPVRLTSGSLAGLTGSTVALPDRVALKIDRGVGTSIKMTLGDGASVDLRVVATFAAERGYESVVLPAELVAAHTTDKLAKQILIRTEPGADVNASLAKLAAANPGVQVADRDALIEGNNQDLQTQAWVNYLLVGMLIAYTAVSVVNTMVSATVRRRREFGLQRLTGSTRGQVLRMLTTEGVLVALAGITLGTLVALASLLPFAAAVSSSAFPSGPIWIYLVIIATAFFLTLFSTLLPATTTLRTRPAEAAARTD